MDKKEYLEKLLKFKNALMERMDVSKMILFGSRANGNFREDSDFDLVIISDDFEGEKSFRRAIEFYKYWDIDSPVDFICLTNKEMKNKKDEFGVVGQALRKGIEI